MIQNIQTSSAVRFGTDSFIRQYTLHTSMYEIEWIPALYESGYGIWDAAKIKSNVIPKPFLVG